jgi:hypothetical protein
MFNDRSEYVCSFVLNFLCLSDIFFSASRSTKIDFRYLPRLASTKPPPFLLSPWPIDWVSTFVPSSFAHSSSESMQLAVLVFASKWYTDPSFFSFLQFGLCLLCLLMVLSSLLHLFKMFGQPGAMQSLQFRFVAAFLSNFSPPRIFRCFLSFHDPTCHPQGPNRSRLSFRVGREVSYWIRVWNRCCNFEMMMLNFFACLTKKGETSQLTSSWVNKWHNISWCIG